jgi:hypothetical protein
VDVEREIVREVTCYTPIKRKRSYLVNDCDGDVVESGCVVSISRHFMGPSGESCVCDSSYFTV